MQQLEVSCAVRPI